MIGILDASVVAKWFIKEDPESTAAAQGVLDDVTLNPRAYAVPELLYSECLHVFARRFDDPSQVEWAMDRIFRLAINPLRFDGRVAAAAAQAQASGLSGYDATYYAFAEQMGGTWLTFDRDAARRCPNQDHVELIG